MAMQLNCQSLCQKENPDLEIVKAVQKVKTQERVSKLKGQAWLDLFNHNLGKSRRYIKKRNNVTRRK